MSPAGDHPEPSDREERRRRRRRLEDVFGTEPSQTSDDLDPAEEQDRSGDTWLREQVPPHHGA